MKFFSKDEIVAVYKAAYFMVRVDGKIMKEETDTVNDALMKLGVSNMQELEDIKSLAEAMTEEECYGQLAFLKNEQKKFVSAMLGAICSSDGDIDDKELELWRKICSNSDLPKMNNRQAISIFQLY